MKRNEAKMSRSKLFLAQLLLLIVGLLSLGMSTARAQQDVFLTHFYDYIAGLKIIHIDNPTSQRVLCAMIYVFDDHEAEEECCRCKVTTNGLRTLTIKPDLTLNSFDGIAHDRGLVRIISSAPNAKAQGCDPTLANTPTPTLRAWYTFFNPPRTVATDPFLSVSPDPLQLQAMERTCAFIIGNGSGRGICTCGEGDTIPH